MERQIKKIAKNKFAITTVMDKGGSFQILKPGMTFDYEDLSYTIKDIVSTEDSTTLISVVIAEPTLRFQ